MKNKETEAKDSSKLHTEKAEETNVDVNRYEWSDDDHILIVDKRRGQEEREEMMEKMSFQRRKC